MRSWKFRGAMLKSEGLLVWFSMDASIFIFIIFRLPPIAQSSAKHIQMKSSFKSNSWIMLYIYQYMYTLDDLIYVCLSLCPSVDAWLGKMVQSHITAFP